MVAVADADLAIALDRDIDSDVCHDLLAHDIDWLMCAVGFQPTLVTAHDQRFHRGRVEHIACELEFPGEIRAHLEASRISATAERSVAVIGHVGSEEVFQLEDSLDGVLDLLGAPDCDPPPAYTSSDSWYSAGSLSVKSTNQPLNWSRDSDLDGPSHLKP